MDIRYSANQNDAKYYTTQELRNEFLIEKLFVEDDMTGVYSHVDRIVTMGCMPTVSTIDLEKNVDCFKDFGVTYFLERRELGIFNIGGQGIVTVDGKSYDMGKLDCLYVAMGTKKVTFASKDSKNPAKFYMCSTPAHKAFTTTFISIADANKSHLGEVATANKRTINQFIHPAVLETCQLSMGCTILNEGSVWNTMPSHTHERRMEVYMYFDMPKDNAVIHLMGEPQETRHILMHSEQAVISPSWSIHSGCGTSAYSFIWAMAGENRTFDDMDGIGNTELR